MKKTAVISLVIMLLAAMLVMTGCGTKQTTVEFTVDGANPLVVRFADPAQKNNVKFQRQEDPNHPDNPAKYTIGLSGDNDYSLLMIDGSNNTYPFVLKLHNGKVETETPEGITVNILSVK